MGQFRVNPVRQRIARGEVAVVATGPNSPDLCDFLGPMGFDGAFVDFEHGPVGWSELANISRACELWDLGTVVRVNRLDEGLILRALDLGASSVVVPHVITADDAERAARACRYPPQGCRGVAGRAYGVEVDAYFRGANEEVQCIALIEDAAALDNLPALLAVDGVDVYHVAPSDLAASMGHTGAPRHPEVQAAIAQAITEIVDAGRTAGTLVADDNVRHFLALGIRFVVVPWTAWIAEGASTFLRQVRKP